MRNEINGLVEEASECSSKVRVTDLGDFHDFVPRAHALHRAVGAHL